MVAKLRCFILTALFVLTLAACASESEIPPSSFMVQFNVTQKPHTVDAKMDGVCILVEPSTVTWTDLSVVIQNDSNDMLMFRDSVCIAQQSGSTGNRWNELPWRNNKAPECWKSLFGIFGKERVGQQTPVEVTYSLCWNDTYGPLPPGEYLLIMEVNRPDEAIVQYGVLFEVPLIPSEEYMT